MSNKKGDDKRSVGTILMEDIVYNRVKLFRAEDDEPYAVLPIGETRQVWHLYSNKVRAWLTKEFWKRQGRTASAAGLTDALRTMEGHANESIKAKLWIRTANDGNDLYIDLGDEDWKVVHVHNGAWNVVQKYPVFFKRCSGSLPLPTPQRDGDFNLLRRYVNVGDDANWRLYRAFVTSCLRPFGPYPILLLSGIQGSAKSTTAAFTRRLVDPNVAAIRQEPKSKHDLIIASDNSWMLCFDNLSFLSQEMSDALCCISTGSGFTARKLFTDRDEAVFAFCRPIVTTAIEDIATRGDLLDRSVMIHCPPIERDNRRSQGTLLAAFEADLGLILGGALDLVAAGQKRFRYVKETGLPRMADWARWGIALEQALGETEGSFLEAYTSNLQVGNVTALENSPLLASLQEVVQTHPFFDGTASELLELLRPAALGQKDVKRFPKTPNQLSGQLRRLAPVLPAAGIEAYFHIIDGRKLIRLKVCGSESVDTIDTPGLARPEDLFA